MLSRAAYSFLKFLDPERAHGLAKIAMHRHWFAPGDFAWPEELRPKLFGLQLPNPLGLAAGFDKNGQLLDAARAYGFGFTEIGSVTHRGGPGNPRPRMFRLPDGLLNRMGLNGDPADEVAHRLQVYEAFQGRSGEYDICYGINLAKTHDPRMVGAEAILDLRESYRALHMFGHYHVLNLSCPNTAEGKTFEDPGALRELLSELRLHEAVRKPLLLKLSPLLASEGHKLADLIKVAQEFRIGGWVASNTFPMVHPQYGKGGQSGRIVHGLAVALTRTLCHQTGLPVIGCGGVMDGRTAFDFMVAGAVAVQAYTGFVHGPCAGADFTHQVLGGLLQYNRPDRHRPGLYRNLDS